MTLVDMSADPAERKRFIDGPQLKGQRRRQAVKSGRVVRASARPTSANGKGRTLPEARRRRRRLHRTDVRDALESLVIASHHPGDSSDEDSPGTSHGHELEGDYFQMDKADFTAVLDWNRKGPRIRQREKKARLARLAPQPDSV